MDVLFIEKVLTLAGRAPSAHNAQPWRVEIKEDRFVVWREKTRTLGASDPTLRQTYIGLGLFTEALGFALSGLGYESETINHAFDPRWHEIVAEVVVGKQIGDEDPTKVELMNARQTNRSIYASEPIPEDVVRNLLTLDVPDGIEVWTMSKESQRLEIAEIIREATQIGLAVPAVREELAAYVSFASEEKRVGLIFESMTDGPRPNCTASEWIVNGLSIKDEAELAYQRFASALLHFGISAAWESTDAWIEVGRALHRALMQITSHGLSHCIAAGPVEIPTIAPRLRTVVGTSGKPQVFVRVGKPVISGIAVPSPRLSSLDIRRLGKNGSAPIDSGS